MRGNNKDTPPVRHSCPQDSGIIVYLYCKLCSTGNGTGVQRPPQTEALVAETSSEDEDEDLGANHVEAADLFFSPLAPASHHPASDLDSTASGSHLQVSGTQSSASGSNFLAAGAGSALGALPSSASAGEAS